MFVFYRTIEMKKSYILYFILFVFCFGCNSITSEKDEIIEEELSKEDALKKLYSNEIITLFEGYKNVEIPTEFKIDTNDNSINAGASFGYVEVSQGLINYKKEYIQVYVLAHEVAHIVTINQAYLFGLGESIPSGSVTNDYKKAEYLADIIAIHLINTQLPEQMKLIYSDFENLKTLLGAGSFTHPSGTKRINMMNQYLLEAETTSPFNSFETVFRQIWNLD